VRVTLSLMLSPGQPSGAGQFRTGAQATVADAMVSEPKLFGRTATIGDVRALFLDDHVHAALIVADGVLISVIHRSDLDPALPYAKPAARFGRLHNRVVRATESLDFIKRQMISTGQRRLAGLLCLKGSLAGFCSDQDVRSRARDAQSLR
jgi:hypothetical protein